MDIHWYPGHMAKARRQMESSLKVVDFVIEVVDARIPRSSRNPDFEDLFKTKARVVVLNKADLADPAATKAWLAWYRAQGLEAAEFVATARKGRDTLLKMMEQAAAVKVERMAARGAKKTVRAMIAGIPNTGKSALINALAGSASARTGDRPGVTRGRQLIRITPWMELMDTPGVLWPRLDDPVGAMNLAFTGAVKDETMNIYKLALELIDALAVQYPGAVAARFQLTDAGRPVSESGETAAPKSAAEVLVDICRRRGCLLTGGEPDEDRAARLLLDEMRAGKLGRLTLEAPGAYEDNRPFEL